ncbi:unnamed protein product [Parascedosporium putredinis]|uniref:Mitochondrial import inner membrane translocase subunit TIM54 n=1 Tax=Parascedosporium putredinis TaxID=1442378 RepID=A0A9P1H5A9_9PEZI|nr:unnamed protein product [Parascedosporium putredinis]CAI7997744.1 unnamed protein product [Parascedosporium putredinis]
MADVKPPTEPVGAAGTTAAAANGPSTAPTAAAKTARPQGNPALRMMGIPMLPKKLPSRNWMIFWALTTGLSAAIIYDKREKNRATAKWTRAVAHLAQEPLGNPNQMPRKITVFLESPLATACRKAHERPEEDILPTNDKTILESRKRSGIAEYEGIKGDLVVGRHTWKDSEAITPVKVDDLTPPTTGQGEENAPAISSDSQKEEEKKEEEKKDEEQKPKRPPQPPSYNTTADYESAGLPFHIPHEFSPSAAVEFPHVLGFTSTPKRFGWFLNRRKLADSIGREVAAVCFAVSADWPEDGSGEYPQVKLLEHEERNWVKSVWKEEKEDKDKTGDEAVKTVVERPKEKIWPVPIVTDPRIMSRMRKFELLSEHEAIAKGVVVPEEEIEGWIKGSFRQLFRWGASQWQGKHWEPKVGDTSDE